MSDKVVIKGKLLSEKPIIETARGDGVQIAERAD